MPYPAPPTPVVAADPTAAATATSGRVVISVGLKDSVKVFRASAALKIPAFLCAWSQYLREGTRREGW